MALLVEDQTDLRDVFRSYLTGMGYSVIEASGVDEARALLRELPEITLILTDLQLEGEETGVDLISGLENTKSLVLFMSSLPADHPLVIRAQRMAPVLAKPFEIGDLRATLKDALNVTTLVTILDDEPEIRRILADTLEEAGFRTMGFSRATEFEAALKSNTPDVCLVDLGLPDRDGLTLVHRLALEQGALSSSYQDVHRFRTALRTGIGGR